MDYNLQFYRRILGKYEIYLEFSTTIPAFPSGMLDERTWFV